MMVSLLETNIKRWLNDGELLMNDGMTVALLMLTSSAGLSAGFTRKLLAGEHLPENKPLVTTNKWL